VATGALVAVGAKGNLDDLAALRSRGDAQLRRLGDAEAEIDLTDGAGSAGDTRRGKHHDIVDIEPPTDGRQLRARAQLSQHSGPIRGAAAGQVYPKAAGYARFDPSSEDLGPYLDGGAMMIEEEAREHREFGIVRPWFEFLIASTDADIKALGIGSAQSIADIVLPHPGIDELPLSEWHHILEWMRHKLFHLDAPMTDDDKARIKREVTIVDDDLDEFRARMKAAGRLDPE